MKYMINWNERPQGSAIEYENVQKRILEIFQHWEIPSEAKVHAFVVRVGEWGGSLLLEADDPLVVHKACSTFPAFQFDVRQVVDIQDAVRVEMEAIKWRDELPS
ncbi:DUF3303 family protein [Mesorhizobium sp. VK9D]|uniref:DUF3303 domain-containing protein n=1 Tax=Mesorhizobium australafricanum TaxID=3072311 RepID=UPI002A24DE03|nr:DUF3303 family protein [Mesorhizobium sp. VK9D]MDX8454917.1 DUF3303 family protein [Mesorhizobium sp. VK9D]